MQDHHAYMVNDRLLDSTGGQECQCIYSEITQLPICLGYRTHVNLRNLRYYALIIFEEKCYNCSTVEPHGAETLVSGLIALELSSIVRYRRTAENTTGPLMIHDDSII